MVCDTDPEYLQCLRDYDSCQQNITFLSDSVDKAAKTLTNMQAQQTSCLTKNEKQKEEIIDLKNSLLSVPPQQITPPKVQYWNIKYPPAQVAYTGRTIAGTDKRYSEDVRNFLTPQDWRIYNWARNRKLFIDDPWKCNNQIALIYRAQMKEFKYARDIHQFGISEQWLYPSELMELKKGDCEDWGHLLSSRLLAGGLPSGRLRNVAGMTNDQKGGHSTVYVLADDFITWYHLNSTGGYAGKDLTKYPTSNDLSDDIGVTGSNIWFAYNNKKSYSQFRTDRAKLDFQADKTSDFIKISKIGGRI